MNPELNYNFLALKSRCKSVVVAIILGIFIVTPLRAAVDYNKLSLLASQRYGEHVHGSIVELQATMNALGAASDMEKLKAINDFFNRNIKFDDDINIWGVSDYWATPLEALGKERGDCEDYAIAKYVFLRELNIPNERLKLTYVRAQIGGPHSKIFQAHMVLSYYATPSAEPLILDSLIADIRPAQRRPDLKPIFSFNSEALWIGTQVFGGDSTAHLSHWRDVLARIRADGIE